MNTQPVGMVHLEWDPYAGAKVPMATYRVQDVRRLEERAATTPEPPAPAQAATDALTALMRCNCPTWTAAQNCHQHGTPDYRKAGAVYTAALITLRHGPTGANGAPHDPTGAQPTLFT